MFKSRTGPLGVVEADLARAGELAALVGVHDLGRAIFGDSLFQSLNAEVGMHGVGQPPRQHFSCCLTPEDR